MQDTPEDAVLSLDQEDSLDWNGITPGGYSCLENSMVSGTWQAVVHVVAKSSAVDRSRTNTAHGQSLLYPGLFFVNEISEIYG